MTIGGILLSLRLTAVAASAVFLVGTLPAAAAHAASASALSPHAQIGTVPSEFYFASGAGDYIGGGVTVDYTDPVVTLTAGSVAVTAGGAGGWSLNLSAPAGQSLAVGTYSGVSLSGNGRGCNNYYGTFTVTEVTATSFNATFKQTCESTTAAPLVGFIRYNATTPTTVPTLPSTAAPITPPPNSGTTSANADEFSFRSASGDYIGQGGSADFTGSNMSASGTLGAVIVGAGPWLLDLSAPAIEQLVPGTYTRSPSNTTTAAGISLFGDGRGCNQAFGTFTIYEIASDNTGKLTKLNATFSQNCEQTTAPPLVGFVRFNATVPTPVPTLPTPLVARLTASTGAADATGKTSVTLDASQTTGTDSGTTYAFDFGDGSTPVASTNPVATKLEWEGTYKVSVTATDSQGHTSTSAPQWLTVGDGYHAVSPTRLLDTRNGTGAPAGAVGSMQTVTLHLPTSVTASGHGALAAVVLNVTVTQPQANGDITVYETGMSQRPTTSNLNYSAGQTIANLVTIPLEPGDDIMLYVHSSGSAQLIADLEGYYTTGADPTNAGFASLAPARIMDTRNGTGGVGGRLGAFDHVSLALPASVPASATAVVMNVTAVNTAAGGNLTVYPDGPGGVPTVSNLNFGAHQITPNLVIVPIPADRHIDFYLNSAGGADLLADLEGYFSDSATAKFVPWFPVRLFDTRKGDAGGALQNGYYIWYPMSHAFNVPVSAVSAALYNVTVTQPQGSGYVSVVPDPINSIPNVSNVNYAAGQTVPNAVLAPMTDGKQDFYNGGSTIQLIVDFFGYFAQPVATDAPPAAAAVARNSAPKNSAARAALAP